MTKDVDNDTGDAGAGHAGVDYYVITGGIKIYTYHGLPVENTDILR